MSVNVQNLAVVGKNYLNFLLGHNLMREDRHIYFIEDSKFGLGSNFSCQIFELEKEFLLTWGTDDSLRPLVNLQKYIEPHSMEYIVPGLRLYLGKSPSENVCELIRKTPDLFYDDKNKNDKIVSDILRNPEIFNLAYQKFCHLVAANIFRYKTFQNLNIDDFLIHCPDQLRTLYECFLTKWFSISKSLEQKDKKIKALMYLFRVNIQNKICLKNSDFEVFHLFLSLLSPGYKIRDEELRSQFEWPKNVEIKKENIDDFKMGIKNIKAASLGEDNIPFKNIFFVSGYEPEEKLELKKQHKTYVNLSLMVKKSQEGQFLTNRNYIFCDPDRLGTRFPFWSLSEKKEGLLFDMAVEYGQGQKIDFYLKDVKSIIQNDTQLLWPHLQLDLENIEVDFGNELYYFDGNWQNHKRDPLARVPVSRKFKAYNSSKNRFKKVNNAYYFGPLKDGPLGLLSTLMEIKDAHKLIGK